MLLFYTVPINETMDFEIEKQLIKTGTGDKNAFEAFYNATRVSVYSYALSIVKNSFDAEDVTHDCYVSIYNNAKYYKPEGKPMAWIFTIVKNLSLQRINNSKKTTELNIDFYENPIDNLALTQEEKSILSKCFLVLSDSEREIVILHLVAGFKHKEIAEYKGMLLPTVLSKYNRALKKLKKSLEEEMLTNE